MKFRIYTSYELFKAIRFIINFKGTHIFFFPRYAMGGAEKVHLDIVKLNKRKPLVIFTSPSHNEFHKQEFLNFAYCIEISEILKFPLLKWTLSCILKVKINKCKVVFGCNSKYFYELIAKINSKSVQIIDLFHTFHEDRKKGILFWSQFVQNKVNQRIVINNIVKTNLTEYYSLNKITNFPKIKVIDNYVEFPNKKREKSSQIKIVYLGRFCTKLKNTQYVFNIAKNLIKDRKFEFHFAGFVRSDAKDHEIPENCTIHGLLETSAVYDLLLQSDLLIITSKLEGFPVVIMEAMICGVVPITTNVGGIPSHVNETNGFIVSYNPDMINQFTNILKRIGKSQLASMSKNGINYAEQNFAKEKFIKNYMDILY